MMSEPVAAIDWSTTISALANLAKDNLASSDFILKVLRSVHNLTDCWNVTYLICSWQEDAAVWKVTEHFSLFENKFKPVDAAKLKIFDSNLLLSQDANERFFQPRATRADRLYLGYVFQIRLTETHEQHIFCLTFNDRQQPIPATSPEKRQALAFLNLFSHIVNSKRLSEVENLRVPRLDAITKLLAISGTLSSAAREICLIWRKWLGVPAVRFWVFNSNSQELDLLHVSSEKPYKKYFDQTNNRLSWRSLGATALIDHTVIRAHHPLNLDEWDDDTGLAELFNYLPQLISVPIISADNEPHAPTTPRFIGLLDLHVRDVEAVQQPDDRMLFLGTISASAILRARSLERYDIIRQLNEIAINLVTSRGQRRLEERKDVYLENVIQVIKKAVNANCVSIFEADESRESLRCIATTGMKGHTEFKKTVFYTKASKLTWKVYETGEPIMVSDLQSRPDCRTDIWEERRLSPSPNCDPMMIFPLPGQTPEKSTGVIRVLERKCPVIANRLQIFSDNDKEIVKLIAHQVSPALQMLHMQSQREIFVERTVHQVLQSLQGVIGYISNVIDGVYKDDPAKEKIKLRSIRQGANSAVRIMRSTQWAATFSDFNFLKEIQRTRAKLTEYFDERIQDFQPIREHEEVNITFVNKEKADKWGHFQVDSYFFEQVVQSLLHNAVRYAYPQTTIEVILLREIKDLKVSIISIGIPIDKKEEERIFEDRGRGKLAADYDTQGTGQGLYIARQIMRGFGGDITLVSHEKDYNVTPPGKFPQAERCEFEIFYPGAF